MGVEPLRLPLTLDRILRVDLDNANVVDDLASEGVSTQLPLRSRLAFVAALQERGRSLEALQFIDKSILEAKRPKNESIVDFFQLLLCGSVLALDQLLNCVNRGDAEKEVWNNKLVVAKKSINRLLVILGGVTEVSRVLTTFDFQSEVMLLPTLDLEEGLASTSKGKPRNKFDDWIKADSGNRTVVVTAAAQAVVLNAFLYLIQVAHLQVHKDENSVSESAQLLEKAQVLFGIANHKRPGIGGTQFGHAAVACAEGNYQQVSSCIEHELLQTKKRKAGVPQTIRELCEEIRAVCQLHVGKAPDEKLATENVFVRELMWLTRDIDPEFTTKLQNLLTTPTSPAACLVLADILQSAGYDVESKQVLDIAHGMCLTAQPAAKRARQTESGAEFNHRFLLAELFYQNGRSQHVQERDEVALEDYRASLSHSGAHQSARFGLVRCLGGRGQLSSAKANGGPLLRRCAFGMRGTSVSLGVKTLLSHSMMNNLQNGQTVTADELLDMFKNNSSVIQENLGLMRLQLHGLEALSVAGHKSCAEPAYQTLRSIFLACVKASPLEKVKIAVMKAQQELENMEEIEDGQVMTLAERWSDEMLVSYLLSRRSVPISYFNQFATLQSATGRGDSALKTLSLVRLTVKTFLSHRKATAPARVEIPQDSDTAPIETPEQTLIQDYYHLLENLELAQLTAMCCSGLYDDLHSRIKKLAAGPNQGGSLVRRREFMLLRALSYQMKGGLTTARQLGERLSSIINSELQANGGNDKQLWEHYGQCIELIFLNRQGVSQDCFQDKTKELLEKYLRQDSQRLGADPTALPMPPAIKSRIITIQGYCVYLRAQKRKLQEQRDKTRQQKGAEGGRGTSHRNSSRSLFQEARDLGRSAIRNDPSNWRALWLISRACRELEQLVASAKVLRLITEKIEHTAHILDRPFIDLVMVQESAIYLATTRKPPPTHSAKLQKGIETAIDLAASALGIVPEANVASTVPSQYSEGLIESVDFLAELGTAVQSGVLARIIEPYLSKALSVLSQRAASGKVENESKATGWERMRGPTLLERYALANVRRLSLVHLTDKKEDLKEIDHLRKVIREAQNVQEYWQALLRDKLKAKKWWVARDPTGQERKSPLVFHDPMEYNMHELVSQDFPVALCLLPWPQRQTRKGSPYPQSRPREEAFVTLNELERMPRDETIKRVIEWEIAPLVRKLREVEPLVNEKLEKDEHEKQQIRLRNQQMEAQETLRRREERQREEKLARQREERVAQSLQREAEDIALSIPQYVPEAQKKRGKSGGRGGHEDDFIDDSGVYAEEEDYPFPEEEQ